MIEPPGDGEWRVRNLGDREVLTCSRQLTREEIETLRDEWERVLSGCPAFPHRIEVVDDHTLVLIEGEEVRQCRS